MIQHSYDVFNHTSNTGGNCSLQKVSVLLKKDGVFHPLSVITKKKSKSQESMAGI